MQIEITLLSKGDADYSARDLGFLLHKHPDHVHTRKTSAGDATIFYPLVSDERTTAVLHLEIDSVGLVRGKNQQSDRLCLAAHGCLPRDLALLWDGLFTAKTEYFGVTEKSWAHSWIEIDMDGHRSRFKFATPSEDASCQINTALAVFFEDGADHSVEGKEVNVWTLSGDTSAHSIQLNQARDAAHSIFEAFRYQAVVNPGIIHRTLEEPKISFSELTIGNAGDVSNPIQSNPIQSNPIQSNPIQSNPTQPSPMYQTHQRDIF